MRYFKLLVMGGIVLALSIPAAALSIPNAPFLMKIHNFDNGSLYAPLPLPPPPGVDTIGVADNPFAGVPQLDPPAVGAAGGMVSPPPPPYVPWAPWSIGTSEDSWGVAKVMTILSFIPTIAHPTGEWVETWNAGTAPTELTWMFYGEEDYFMHQLNAEEQLINGVNLHADLYEQPKAGGTAFDPSLGSAGRAGLSGYNTVTDGTLIVALDSTPGFLHGVGVEGGATAEFENRYNTKFGNGVGDAYFNVVGGTQQSYFDTNTILSPIGAPAADMHAHFTAYPNTGGTQVADWLVYSEDPVRGFQVPEPATMAGLLLGIGCLGRYLRKRR
jgi:hypothetical protein